MKDVINLEPLFKAKTHANERKRFIEGMDKKISQVEADMALCEQMEKLYGEELGLEVEEVERIKRSYFDNRDRYLKGLI